MSALPRGSGHQSDIGLLITTAREYSRANLGCVGSDPSTTALATNTTRELQ